MMIQWKIYQMFDIAIHENAVDMIVLDFRYIPCIEWDDIHSWGILVSYVHLLMACCPIWYKAITSLQWRHNGPDGVSKHQPHACLLNRLFRRRSKKTSKPRVTGLCAGNSPVIGEISAQRASNVENVSIWWCLHDEIKKHLAFGLWPVS